MFNLTRTLVEGTAIASLRTTLGDEKTAELLFDQPYDEGFVRRNNTQLGSLWKSYCEAQTSNGGDP